MTLVVMVMIASNETAESLQGQQLMEASWVVLKTSVPPAWALLSERWSLFTISQNSLPIFCFTQFNGDFTLSIFSISYELLFVHQFESQLYCFLVVLDYINVVKMNLTKGKAFS